MPSPKPVDPPRVFLGLGGNLGDVLSCLCGALRALTHAGVELVHISSAYETVALLAPGTTAPAPNYWNAVCEIRTALAPLELLAAVKTIEREAGRVPGPRWASRPLDIDMLAYGHIIAALPTLRIPHPEILHRSFVLKPWAEIAPEFVLVDCGLSVEAALQALSDTASKILRSMPGWFPPDVIGKSQLS